MCYKQNGMSAEQKARIELKHMQAGEQARRLAKSAAEKNKAVKNASDDKAGDA